MPQPRPAPMPAFSAPSVHKAVEVLLRGHPGLSGFNLIKTGSEAFCVRRALIQSAQERLDLQYYIVQDDLTGKLLVEELLRAADRGVRVRILLDDLDFRRASETILILDSHAHIEIRIFNPASTRRQKWLNKLLRFSAFFERYSKRMHNKALIADGMLAVAGGRNLGDEYFDARAAFAFNDLDVLALGPVVDAIQQGFDAYWDARASHSLHSVGVDAPPPRTVAKHRITLRRFHDDVAHRRMVSKLPPEKVIDQLLQGSLPFVWAQAEFLADHPDKVLTPVEQAESPPMQRLEALLKDAGQEFLAVSPYFIPARYGQNLLARLRRRGMRVRILTNSLASTDVSAVHSVYARYRTKLLELGVELFELRPIPGRRTRNNLLRKGSSRSSLHGKVYVIDRAWVMIGSMNLDPRSWSRNTETMLVMRSEALAQEVLEMFEEITVPECSFHLRLRDGGKVEWLACEKGRRKCYSSDPHPGLVRRLLHYLFYHIAPEGQL